MTQTASDRLKSIILAKERDEASKARTHTALARGVYSGRADR